MRRGACHAGSEMMPSHHSRTFDISRSARAGAVVEAVRPTNIIAPLRKQPPPSSYDGADAGAGPHIALHLLRRCHHLMGQR
eukprot:NODE_31215_length_401_cov_2.127737.p2 GENE.NODE_31215_length_401_cov_2.127737~~NODE_31215_length_401_cov_2.127737.p2  ORF type:complete len:81 (-),score=9.77 NODE_31215_length_401_cov_2.127737:92-334(-)